MTTKKPSLASRPFAAAEAGDSVLLKPLDDEGGKVNARHKDDKMTALLIAAENVPKDFLRELAKPAPSKAPLRRVLRPMALQLRVLGGGPQSRLAFKQKLYPEFLYQPSTPISVMKVSLKGRLQVLSPSLNHILWPMSWEIDGVSQQPAK